LVLQMIADFIRIFYAPNKVLDKIIRRVRGPVTFIAKLMFAFGLTAIASMIAFSGVMFFVLLFLAGGLISFSPDVLLAPFYAAIIIPVVFWIIDTMILLASIAAVGGKIDIIGTLNLRAFSMAPIPLKLLYIFAMTRKISLLALISIPTTVASWLLTIWSILLLTNGIRKYFGLTQTRSFIAAIMPFLTKALIAFIFGGL